MSIEILDLTKAHQWTSYLKMLPFEQQDIYYTPEYYSLYENIGDGKAICFVFENNGNIALYPFLINSVNDLGYDLNKPYFDIQGAYGYNGVVSSSYNRAFIEAFYKEFDRYVYDSNIIAEFTRFHPLLANQKFSVGHLNNIFDRLTIYIDLTDNYETIFNRFERDTKREIRRTFDKYYLEVRKIENDIEIIDQFFPIYQDAMKRVNAVEYMYFNPKYFKQIIQNAKSVLFLAYFEQKPIAGIIIFYNNYFIHLHLGGALTDFINMAPSERIYSEIVKFGIEKKCKILHAGGGLSASPDDKLLKYKMNFSRSTAEFYIGKKIHNQQIYNDIVEQWSLKYPEISHKFKNVLLKYRN